MGRPFVYLNLAMTADGKITSALREYPKFTSPADRLTMDTLRAQADAVLIGAGTLRADDPPMQLRNPEALALRKKLGKGPGLINVVVSRSANISAEARFFKASAAPAVIVATVQSSDAAALQGLGGHVEVWRMGHTDVDLPELLHRLKERGVNRLLVEGGGDLNFRLIEQDLVDEMHITIAPALLGGAAAPTWLDGHGFAMASQRRLRLIEAKVVGDEIYCHWALSGPDAHKAKSAP